MISLSRPSDEAVEKYRQDRAGESPTATVSADPSRGFRRDRFTRVIGSGPADFERARTGLRQWAAHRGSGMQVFPSDAELVEGSTVAVLTRQLGLWVLACCRLVAVVDEPTRFGFAYATLPDHPECGVESFVVIYAGDKVEFDIEAISRPGIALVRFATPITQVLQRRASDAYLVALQEWVGK